MYAITRFFHPSTFASRSQPTSSPPQLRPTLAPPPGPEKDAFGHLSPGGHEAPPDPERVRALRRAQARAFAYLLLTTILAFMAGVASTLVALSLQPNWESEIRSLRAFERPLSDPPNRVQLRR